MLLSEVTTLGDKIDIQLIQQMERAQAGGSTEPIHVYKSAIADYLSDGELEIAMPQENGKMVLFQIGLRCHLLFYTNKGLYSCMGVVQNRYKKNNIYLLSMVLTSGPEKFQRREFFRIGYSSPINYVLAEPDVVEISSTDALMEELETPAYSNKHREGASVDISGGGIRFTGTEKLPVGSFVVVEIRLHNSSLDQTFCLVAEIVASDMTEQSLGRYVNRAKFNFKDIKDREVIVRFVFDEERRIRRRGN